MKRLPHAGIRPAAESDFEGIFDLWRKHQFGIALGPLPTPQLQAYREKFRMLFESQSETFRFFVSYTAEGDVLGWSALFPRPSSPKDAELVVMVDEESMKEELTLSLVGTASTFSAQTELERLFMQGPGEGFPPAGESLNGWEATPTEEGVYWTLNVSALQVA